MHLKHAVNKIIRENVALSVELKLAYQANVYRTIKKKSKKKKSKIKVASKTKTLDPNKNSKNPGLTLKLPG